MNDIIRSLFDRKSVRAYEPRPVSESDKALIIRSAMEAPTGGNLMHYSILDITDQAIKDQLAESCDHQPFIAAAPLLLLFAADLQRLYDAYRLALPDEPIRAPGPGDMLLACSDAMVAAQNSVVAAESLGLGSCYIGDIIERYEFHRDLLNLPDYVLPISLVCYGYPTTQQKERKKPVRFAKEHIVFENAYRRLPESELVTLFAPHTDKPFAEHAAATCRRKYTSEFAAEMNRSGHEMIKVWLKNSD